MELSTNGSASEMNPGLLPVLCTEVPPVAQAASTRSRTAGSMLSGWWNSPRVVTTFAPDARIRVLDHAAQRAGADVPGGPLDHAQRRHNVVLP
jgi:hypothetical protein